MKTRLLVSAPLAVLLVSAAWAAEPPSLANPAIDMAGHLRISAEAARHRRARRVSEAEFIRMSREPGTVVLDARSREKYDQLHVKGAIHLSFSDIAVESLKRLLPDKNTRILIYCNNNFSPGGPAFPTKLASASLNLSTFIALYDYGYRNVYELAPLLDLGTSRLEFEGTSVLRHPRPGRDGGRPAGAAAEAAPSPATARSGRSARHTRSAILR